ncbi:apolipoprotein N-acyltransferase [Candidatus Poribacteria bacterium]|nr:MAG: apolipoprotein N-acyltransferase [Candidatus Poribacteria bacterium]
MVKLIFLKHYRYWLAACSGILLFCSYPNINFYPIAWVALVPLLIGLDKVDNWKSAFIVGYISGLLFFAGLLFAIVLLYPYANIFVTILGYVLLAAYTAVYFGLFSVFVHHLRWKSGILYPLAVATVWVSLEWVRGWLFTGFPWGYLGYSQWNNPSGIQIASITGVYGVSFLIIFLNAGIASIIIHRNEWRKELTTVGIPFLITVICIGYGVLLINRNESTPKTEVKVGLIPGNIKQIDKWNSQKFPEIYRKYIRLTLKAAQEKPDLIVWPETTVRGQILTGAWTNYHNILSQMMNSNGDIPMIIGATDPDAMGDIYNRVISLSSDGEILGKYAKMHLVPFGEYVPLSDFLPNFIQFLPFEPGKSVEILPITKSGESKGVKDSVKIGTSICFESAFPNHFRKFVKKGANIMGILTNDAWFVGTAFPELHLAMAPLRAVENRIDVFRCANGGYTCTIDKFGRISSSFVTPVNNKDYVISGISLFDGYQTIYTRYGDWFPILSIIVTLLIFSVKIVIHKNTTRIQT